MRVIFHPEAHAEMIEHARYYEVKSEGLGWISWPQSKKQLNVSNNFLNPGLSSEPAFASDSSPVFFQPTVRDTA